MTEQMTMNVVIHQAFRRDLRRFDRALSAFPAGSRTRAEQLGLAWDNLAHQLHHHHDDEESIFWPALRALGAEEDVVEDLEGEHASMLAALDAADAAMKRLRADPSAPMAAAARTAVDELRRILLGHLDHEERSVEPLALRSENTPQMKSAKRDVRRSHQGNAGVFVAWLSDDITPEAKACLDKEMPRPIQFVFRNTSGRRYSREIAPVWAA